MDAETLYTRTRGGVTIAYRAYGNGPAIVTVPSVPVSNLEMELELPGSRLNAERVGRYRTLVRFDLHGFGHSQRDALDFSLDACVADIEAVVDRIGCETFALEAIGLGTPIALAYAARHSERVTHLVLSRVCSRLEEIAGPSTAAIVSLAESDWTVTTETLARVALGWGQHELAASIAEVIRGSTTPASLLTFFEQANAWDVTAMLPRVTCPTLLVAVRDGASAVFLEPTRRIAASLPNARLVELGAEDAQGMPAVTWTFLGVPELAEPVSPRPRITLLLFADIADSTSLTETLGDESFRAKARRLDAALRSVIDDHGGRLVEGRLLGDGVLATFQSAAEGVQGASAVVEAGERAGLPLHVGLHAGDVIVESDNVFGGAVNIAARICALSAAGEVLVSGTVRELARTSAGVVFEDRGEVELKGVGEAVRVYAVREREGG